MKNKNAGLLKKYIITKADGRPVDPKGQYFVLRTDIRPDDSTLDRKHVDACRKALRVYAQEIEPYLPELASDLRAFPLFRDRSELSAEELEQTHARAGYPENR